MKRVGGFLQQNSYSAQLQSEQWKSFSSEVRKERGNFCEMCRKGGVETQVHHLFYDPSLKLWEYSKEDLIVLCRPCHQEIHKEFNKFRRYVFRFMRPEHLRVLNAALGVGLTESDPLEFVHAVAEMAASPSSIKRFAYAWNGEQPEAVK